MAANLEVLRIAVEEQRRFHDELTSSYRSMRLRIITFIGAILALLAFLYSGSTDRNVNTLRRLFIPDTQYGMIFYFLGLGFLLYALAKLVHGARPNGRWGVPIDLHSLESLDEKDTVKYLMKLKNEYIKVARDNMSEHAKKHEALRDSFYPLLIGAILLVVLKYFQ